jgi:hypothetical protein
MPMIAFRIRSTADMAGPVAGIAPVENAVFCGAAPPEAVSCARNLSKKVVHEGRLTMVV